MNNLKLLILFAGSFTSAEVTGETAFSDVGIHADNIVILVEENTMIDQGALESALPDARYRVLGTHSGKGCFIVQFKNVTPEGLPTALRKLRRYSRIVKVEPCPID